MLRKNISARLLGLSGLVGSTVVTMMWPSISPSLGYPILGLCLLALVVGGLLAIPDIRDAWNYLMGRSAQGLVLRNAKVIFDPSGPTEMYVDFEALNLGQPLLITGMRLNISDALGPIATLTPRWESTGNVRFTPNPNPGRPAIPHTESPLERPIAHLERLPNCRVGFTVSGDAKSLYGAPRNKFVLTVNDVTGKITKIPVMRL